LPAAYTELVLCRDIYHCPPDALDRLPLQRVAQHLAALRAERRHQALVAAHQRKRR
jgi:hypothetical protein